jgi:hypothetical protein
MLTEYHGDRMRRSRCAHIRSGRAQSGDGYAGRQRYASEHAGSFPYRPKLSDRALSLTGMGREVSGSMVRPGDAFAA